MIRLSKMIRLSIFTDGACSNNGKKGSKAGIGVYIPSSNTHVSKRLPEYELQTNQRAELRAILQGIKLVNYKYIEICTDSMYSIQCFEKWIYNWIGNGWKTATGKPVQHQDILMEIYDILKDRDVKWTHIRSHKKEPIDEEQKFYWNGNKIADELATLSIL